MKHRKPKTLRLTPKSDAAVERLAASMAFMDLPEYSTDAPNRHRYREKALAMLEHLARTAR